MQEQPVDLITLFCIVSLIAVPFVLVWLGNYWSAKNADRLQKEREVEQYYEWVLEHGAEMQKQTALLYFQNKNLEALKRMVAIDIFLD